jgi:putative phage-type endonuclease
VLTSEQIEMRRRCVGASEIGAIAGLSPYATAMDVAARKLGLSDDETSPAAEWGERLEPVVATAYEEREGVRLAPVPSLRAESPADWMLATPDRQVVPEKGELPSLLVEIKTAGLRQAGRWGPEGTDAVPSEYVAQCTWQMAVARRLRMPVEAVDLAVLIGGQELRLYRVLWDASLAAELEAVGEEFVQAVIVRGQLPDPAKCRRASQYLQRRFPSSEGSMLRAEGSALRLCQEFEGAKLAFDHATSAYEAARARLQAVIGDAEGIEWGEGCRVTWRKSKDQDRTDWKALSSEAGIPATLLVKHTKHKPGPRVFRCYGIGEDAENGED